MGIGKRTRQALRHSNMTQLALSKAIDVTPPAISNIIKHDPETSKHAAAIAVATGVSLRWLVTGKGVMLDADTKLPDDAAEYHVILRRVAVVLVEELDKRGIRDQISPAQFGELIYKMASKMKEGSAEVDTAFLTDLLDILSIK